MTAVSAPRMRCYRCLRPARLCHCAELPRVATRTALVVLQHPREHMHPFGTARLVRNALPSARLQVARGGEGLHFEIEVPDDAAVLFPHASACDLAALEPSERPSTLVVLDGTWAHAKRLYRENPWLHGLRHVRLHPERESNYRIRKEPQADYVSTVEAVVQALQILEPDNTGLADLLAAFDRMIDRQLACLHTAGRHGRHKQKRQRPSRRLPAVLDGDDLVVAYAEAVLADGDPAAPRTLVQWTAARVATGEVFEAMLRPAVWPQPHHFEHMELPADSLDGGCDVATARARFDAFAGPTAAIASWTRGTHEWASDIVGNRPTTVLKTCYGNLEDGGSGGLEEVLARHDLTPVTVDCRGRARQRLGNALVLAQWLQARRRAMLAGT